MRRRATTANRILIMPIEVAGVAASLQDGLRKLGRDVDLLLTAPHPFGYPYVKPASRLRAWVFQLVMVDPVLEGRLQTRLRSLFARLLVMPFLLSYDAVVYMGADTLHRGGLDRRLLKAAGARVVTVFCGSDARAPYLSGRWADPVPGPVDLDALMLENRRVADAVALAERDSTYVVNQSATAQFNRLPYLNWTVMGLPSKVPVGEPATPSTANAEGSVRILHAPSVARWKGTPAIREAVQLLRDEGLDIDYVEAVGMSNAEVLREISTADIIVDQVYSDSLLATLGTEAARAGKAVLLTGYAGPFLQPLADRMGIPQDQYYRPEELVDELRRLVISPKIRTDLGRRLQEFVSDTWSSTAIALRYAAVLDGKPEESWFSDPSDLPYLGGWGADENKIGDLIRKFTDAFGANALGLNPAGTNAAVNLPQRTQQ